MKASARAGKIARIAGPSLPVDGAVRVFMRGILQSADTSSHYCKQNNPVAT